MNPSANIRVAAAVLAVFCIHAIAVLPSAGAVTNVLGYWKLDEGSGTTTSDSSGNGNDGTVHSSPDWVSGQFGSALQFSGPWSGNFVTTPVTWPTSGTVMLWAKPNSIGDWISPAGWKSAGGYTLIDEGSGGHPWRAVFKPNLGGGSPAEANVAGSSVTTDWTHVAMTWNLSGGVYTIHLYINGVKQADGGNNTWAGTADSPGTFAFGGDNSTDNDFSGSVDTVKVYTVALTDAQIAELAKAPRTEPASKGKWWYKRFRRLSL